ncbi:MAG TPA: septum formation initiator family protein [Methylomusa anaerophila]|uniref:Cell division protein FtsB n=1 Tax=Methylomusa anaerophila TaxID=1930071 RepID=A0A348AJK3_9FIRM|nr:septum formation initiator family protein [Methylomusa anaerophila]BBB91251.1 cell division protein FtsB [Methylomusa anaerophila]HML89755.1 septum formation initiator family protein [Methylomusa anaerophila]
MQKNRKRARFSWFRFFLLVLTAYFLYAAGNQQLELFRIRQEAKIMSERLQEVTRENQALAGEKEKLNQAAYIEKLAREQLGLVKPGEVPYIPASRPENSSGQ